MKKTAALAWVLGFVAWQCAHFTSAIAEAALPYTELYQRVTNEFAHAEYYKPAERRTNEPSFTLAPLIMQQIRATGAPSSTPDRFGTLNVSNGDVTFDPSHPTIYWASDTVQIKSAAFPRLSYVWWYAPSADVAARGPGPGDGVPAQGGADSPLQGIRVTLNSAGQPLIWEVLAEGTGAKLFFVAAHLEAAAMAEFGKPLPGRRYSIECSLDACPDVIVARVLDDSPVPAGPIVYLNAGTRSVGTLTCRCMPAQARKLLDTTSYDLLPFDLVSSNSIPTYARSALLERTAFWPGDAAAGKRLEACLRLPETIFGARK